MDLIGATLEGWDRQAGIVRALSGRVDDKTRSALPSEDGWPLDLQFAHIQAVRLYWLNQAASVPEGVGSVMEEVDGERRPFRDLNAIRVQLDASASAVREALEELLQSGAEAAGPYSHPLHFFHHLLWHEGWHVGLIMLALRKAGHEPSEEWEEKHLWEVWRGPEEW